MSQNTSSNKKPGTLKELLHLAAGPFLFIVLLIMVCAFLTHLLLGSETLEEYAKANPEIAYGTAPEDQEAGSAEANTEQAESESTDSEPAVTNSGTDTPINMSNRSDPETSDEPPAYNTSKDTIPDGNESTTSDSAADRKEPDNMAANTERTTYQTGFYYEPLSDSIKDKITGISYPESGCTIAYEDLNYVGLLYIDFNGEEQTGELICNKAIAQDMVEIFYELYQNDYRIERIRLIDEYDGDDTLSMMDNNTSCFNYRVVDGTTNLSKHALGCAIDINPFYNPYVVFNKDGTGETYISPKGSEVYTDRSLDFPYKIDENDLCYKLFTEHGFTWGGNWNSCKDYQHFQIVL